MASAPFTSVVRYFRGTSAPAPGEELTDRQLLNRFTCGRDESAFATLVSRHGPLVMGVCRRVLRNDADAEDAFQATFLVLARRAALVAWRSSVANWLHGTALRLARKLLVANSRRQARERRAAAKVKEASAQVATEWQELCNLLDGQMRRLPGAERSALLACYFEGRTQDEAARELGWSLRTLQRRLERGRDLLRPRLVRQGVPLPVAFLAGVLLNEAAAAGKAAEIARAAAVFVAGGTPTARAAATTLAVSALRANARGMFRLAVAGLLLLGACAAAIRFDFLLAEDEEVPQPAASSQSPVVRPLVDASGDPLPKGAVGRLGSLRLRHTDAISWATFSQDGETVIVGDKGGHVVRWDVASGWRLRLARQAPRRGEEAKDFQSLALPPDGKVLAAIENHQLVFREVASGQRRYGGEPGYPADHLTVSSDGRTVATWSGSDPQTLDLWDATTGKHRDWAGHRNPVTSLSYSGDGELLLSADGVREQARLWEPATGRELAKVGPPSCREVVFAPDGKSFVAFQSETHLSGLWDTASGQPLDRLIGYSCSSRNLCYGAGGRLLVEGVWGRKIARLWDAQTGEMLWEIGVAQDHPARVTLSPGGTVVASGGYDGGPVRRWNTRTGMKLSPLNTPHKVVRTVAIAPGGRTMATSGDDDPVYLWDPQAHKQLHRLEGLAGAAARTLAFTADGRRLLGVGGGRARVWDVATGDELERFEGHDGAVTAAAISPDGRFAATGGSDTTILVWDLTGGKTAERHLSSDEVERLWAELADPDDRIGYRAAGTLAAVPGQAIALLADRLRAQDPPLRLRRALLALERIDTPEARQFLEKLASGASEDRLTREARAITARRAQAP